mgnify:CR=1 FL=1
MSSAMELKLYDTLTREKRVFSPIDPVRVITNRSSGKMGFAVARAARGAGTTGDAPMSRTIRTARWSASSGRTWDGSW